MTRPLRPATLALALLACSPSPAPAPLPPGPAGVTAAPPPSPPPEGGSTTPPPASPAPLGSTGQVGVRNIDVNALKADLDRGAVPLLLDVRSPEEFGAGHVLGAKNMPMETVAQHLAEFPPDGGEVYVICARGGRSASTSAMLSENGIHPVNVEGGMTAWVSAGLPVEK